MTIAAVRRFNALARPPGRFGAEYTARASTAGRCYERRPEGPPLFATGKSRVHQYFRIAAAARWAAQNSELTQGSYNSHASCTLSKATEVSLSDEMRPASRHLFLTSTAVSLTG